MLKDLKRSVLGGLGAAAVVGGLLAAGTPAIAAEGDHYSRQHPDSYEYGDPTYAAGGVAADAGDVASDAVDGTGDLVAGTIGGVTDPYVRGGPAYYGDRRGYARDGYTYHRRGAYYYPGAPRANGYERADGRWDWSSDGQYRRGTALRGSALSRGDYESMPGDQPDDF